MVKIVMPQTYKESFDCQRGCAGDRRILRKILFLMNSTVSAFCRLNSSEGTVEAMT